MAYIKKQIIKNKPKVKKKTKSKNMMKEHSKKHSKKHITIMKKEIKKGASFSLAHKKAMKK
jgi:predicted RNA-binding protein YlxR (DUF448 family)